uniref:Mediator of RNA polymerase II transcription subunit 9 n=1 Tax=Pygocentrus nattereri TaxID=42514 RepID=A0AAR2KFG7_PYGNA
MHEEATQRRDLSRALRREQGAGSHSRHSHGFGLGSTEAAVIVYTLNKTGKKNHTKFNGTQPSLPAWPTRYRNKRTVSQERRSTDATLEGAMAAVQTKRDLEEDYSLLPVVHDIIKCIDKDSADVHQELVKLKSKIQEARDQISSMPGIDVSPAVQQQQLLTLREQVRTKKQLLKKYKSLCMFEVPKAS